MSDAPPIARVPLWRRLLPFVIAAALIAWLCATVDLDGFLRGLGRVDVPLFLLFAAAMGGYVLVTDSIATAYVYRRTLGPVPFRDLLAVRGASYLPNLVNYHVGQAWMTYYLSRAYKTQLWRVAGATLLVFATTLGGLWCAAALSIAIAPGRFAWMPIVVAIGGAAALAYLIVIAIAPAALARRPLTGPLVEAGVRGHLAALALRLPHVVGLFVGAWLPFRFFGIDLPFADALALIPPLLVVISLPITPAGVGTRDAFAVHVLVTYASGAPDDRRAAILASTLTWAVVSTLVQVAIALLCLPRARRLLARSAAM